MTNFKPLDVSEQLAVNGQASRSREARDQKYFVQSLFKEIETLKQDNREIKELLREALCKLDEKKTKKASLLVDKDKAE